MSLLIHIVTFGTSEIESRKRLKPGNLLSKRELAKVECRARNPNVGHSHFLDNVCPSMKDRRIGIHTFLSPLPIPVTSERHWSYGVSGERRLTCH